MLSQLTIACSYYHFNSHSGSGKSQLNSEADEGVSSLYELFNTEIRVYRGLIYSIGE